MKLFILQLLLLLAVSKSAAGQTMIEGKIFSTPEQRQYLDYRRKDFLEKNKQKGFDIEEAQVPEIPTNTATATATANDAPATPVEYTFDAVMTRADGRLTLWLNHQPVSEKQLPANFRLVREGNTLALRVKTADGRNQLLRPGQSIDVNSGVVKERLHQAAVQTPKHPTEPAAKANEQQAAIDAEAAATQTGDKTGTDITTPKESAGSAAQGLPLVIESLPAEALQNSQTLDSMIKTLEALKKGLDENKNQ